MEEQRKREQEEAMKAKEDTDSRISAKNRLI
jgi:hypothetical protein